MNVVPRSTFSVESTFTKTSRDDSVDSSRVADFSGPTPYPWCIFNLSLSPLDLQ